MGVLNADCWTLDGERVDVDPACAWRTDPVAWTPPGYHSGSVHEWSLEDTLQAFGLTAGVALVVGAGVTGECSHAMVDWQGVS